MRGTVYRVAEFRLRSRLAQTRAVHSQSNPQTDGPPQYAALVFPCFEGMELLHVQTPATSFVLALRLQPVIGSCCIF